MTTLRHLKLSDQLANDCLTGKFSLRPVEYLEWAIALEDEIDSLRRRIELLEDGE